MKAAVLYGNEDIRYDDWEEPAVGHGLVKVRVQACGICGSDVPRVLANGSHGYPIILGHEFSGDVIEVGEGVKRVQVGDRVACAPLVPCMECPDCILGNYSLCKHYSFIGSRQQGGFAEYIVMPERNAVVFDPSTDYEQGAFFEPSTVALHGLLCNQYRGGGRVAVLGGGTIGIFTLQWAQILGASSVTVFDLDDERLALARQLGATETVNTAKDGFMETAGQFDYLFETAGAVPTIKMAYELAANKAHICCIGTPTREVVFQPAMWEKMNRKEFTLTGSWMSYSAPFPGKEWEMTARCFADGRLRFDPALIFRTFPLSQAADAFALYKTPGAVKGKILLIP